MAQLPETNRRRNHLCQHGHCRRTAHARLEHKYAQGVQYDIQNGGNNDGIKRRLAVPQGTEDACTQIVGDAGCKSSENDVAINQTVLHDLFRSLQQKKHLPEKEHADDRKQSRHAKRQQNGGCHRAAQILLIACPIILSSEDGKTIG